MLELPLLQQQPLAGESIHESHLSAAAAAAGPSAACRSIGHTDGRVCLHNVSDRASSDALYLASQAADDASCQALVQGKREADGKHALAHLCIKMTCGC